MISIRHLLKMSAATRENWVLLLLIFSAICVAGVEPALAGAKTKMIVSSGVILEEFGLKQFFWQLWNTILSNISPFWVFLTLVVATAWSSKVCGVVLTVGGAFLPDANLPGKANQTGVVEVSATKFLFRGAPRCAVCLAGIILIIYSSNG